MSSYNQYKAHIFDKNKNGPYCQSKSAAPEYARHVDEINCHFCLRLVEKTKKQIAFENAKKALTKVSTSA